MCGIAGWLGRTEDEDPDRGWVASALDTLAHRGPDDAGTWSDEHAVLGNRRLAVVDPTSAGRQPMLSRDGRFVVTFNGEIYNHRELRGGLEPLRGRCDTEVLVELLAAEGPAALRALRGMWAFVAWDRQEQVLIAARDPFGIKPLFWSRDAGSLRVASEVKALVPRGDPALDDDALRRYLAFGFVPPPATLRPGVRAVPPGGLLTARPGRDPELSLHTRVGLRPRARASGATAPRGLAALRDSVAVHLRGDAPIGTLLSGGVDSTAITALAAEQRPGLPAFTVGFGREGFSEVELAAESAEALGVELHTTVVGAEEFAAALPHIAWQLDDPLADAAAIPLWFVARAARRRVTVVLSGEGADELFAGYPDYCDPDLATGTPAVPHEYIGAEHIHVGAEVDRYARQGAGTARDVSAPLHAEARAAGFDPVTTMQHVDLSTWLPGDILLKADRVSMAHGLELRVPFLDREVLAVAARLSPSEKVGGGRTKLALRAAVAGVVPPEVAVRPKLGFPVPIGHWLRGELHGWARELFLETQADEHLDQRAALDLLGRYRSGEDFDWRRVWSLVMFCVWHQVHVERRHDVAAPAAPVPSGV